MNQVDRYHLTELQIAYLHIVQSLIRMLKNIFPLMFTMLQLTLDWSILDELFNFLPALSALTNVSKNEVKRSILFWSEILTPYQFIIWDDIYDLIVPWTNLGNHNLGVWIANDRKEEFDWYEIFHIFSRNKRQKRYSLHKTSKLPILNRLLSRLIMVKDVL